MNKFWRCKFRGRRVGAIGITYEHNVVVEAQTPEEAEAKLYEKYEHIRGHGTPLVITEINGDESD